MVNIFSGERSSQESRGFSHERFNDNNIDVDIATRFTYNAIPPMNRYADFGIVVAVAYDKKEKRFLYAIEVDVDNTVVLVDDSTLDITGIKNKKYAC